MVVQRRAPKRTRLPHGQGRPRPSRVQKQGDARKLRNWVQRQNGSQKPPSLNKALASKHISHVVKRRTGLIDFHAVAVGIIRENRPRVNPEPCLQTMPAGERPTGCSKSAEEEYERRTVERGLFEELSMYCPLGPDQREWTCPRLLSKGKRNTSQCANGIPLT